MAALVRIGVVDTVGACSTAFEKLLDALPAALATTARIGVVETVGINASPTELAALLRIAVVETVGASGTILENLVDVSLALVLSCKTVYDDEVDEGSLEIVLKVVL